MVSYPCLQLALVFIEFTLKTDQQRTVYSLCLIVHPLCLTKFVCSLLYERERETDRERETERERKRDRERQKKRERAKQYDLTLLSDREYINFSGSYKTSFIVLKLRGRIP